MFYRYEPDLHKAIQNDAEISIGLSRIGLTRFTCSCPTLTGSPESTDPTVVREASTLTPIPTAMATDPSPSLSPSPLPSPVPSLTPLPSSTPLPSDTPVPTATEDVCSTLARGGIGISDKEVSLEISNGGSTAVTITHIIFDWPAVNEDLKKVRLGDSTIWNKRDDSPATDIQSDWLGNRVLIGGEVKPLKFEFVAAAAASGYDLLVEFDAGCQLLADG